MGSLPVHTRLQTALARDVPSVQDAAERVRQAIPVYDRMQAISSGLDFLNAGSGAPSESPVTARTRAQATIALHFAHAFLPETAATTLLEPPSPAHLLAALNPQGTTSLEEVLGLPPAQTESVEQALQVLRTFNRTMYDAQRGMAAELFLAVVQQNVLQALESPLPETFAIPAALKTVRSLYPEPLLPDGGTDLARLLTSRVSVRGDWF